MFLILLEMFFHFGTKEKALIKYLTQETLLASGH